MTDDGRTVGRPDGQLRECDGRADHRIVCTSQLGDPHQRDDGLWLLVPPLHVRIQIGPTGDEHAVGARISFHTQRFGERSGLQVLERR